MTSRYYCGDQPLASGQRIDLPADESRHLLKTMRGRIGDQLIVFGSHGQFIAELAGTAGNTATVQLGEALEGAKKPHVSMTFLVPWIKGGKTDFLVQKLTELGAAGITVFQARRDVARGDESKVDRLARIAVEACKQCERTDVPVIETAASLASALTRVDHVPSAQRLILHERDQTLRLTEALKQLSDTPGTLVFASGPEGGWHPDELEAVHDLARFVSLGQRILRAETAPIVAASAVLAFAGDI